MYFLCIYCLSLIYMICGRGSNKFSVCTNCNKLIFHSTSSSSSFSCCTFSLLQFFFFFFFLLLASPTCFLHDLQSREMEFFVYFFFFLLLRSVRWQIGKHENMLHNNTNSREKKFLEYEISSFFEFLSFIVFI